MHGFNPSKAECRVCTHCGEAKPLDEYYRYNRKTHSGVVKPWRYRHCKACHSIKTRTWEKQNPETLRAAQKRWRDRPENRERRLESLRKWKVKRGPIPLTEEQKRRQRERKRANNDKQIEYRRKWLSKPENRARYNAWQANRRARKRNAAGNFTIVEWLGVCETAGWKCLCCGKAKPLTVDHVIPLSAGGDNRIANIQPLCFSCNASKGAKHTDYRVAQ